MLLPFIDADRLLDAVAPEENKLSDEEKYRNAQRLELLFMHVDHPLATTALVLAEEGGRVEIDPSESRHTHGFLRPPHGEAMPTVVRAPFPGLGPDVEGNAVVAAAYEFPTHQKHVSKIMPGTIMPERECDENDMPPIEEPWHLTRGRGGGFGGGPRGGGGSRGRGGGVPRRRG